MRSNTKTTVGSYLVTRLEQMGLGHVFGVPGDYVLGFYDLLEASDIKVIGTCTEIGAGYAADAYARVNGLGAVCVTYCVGGLNAVNAVAGAYAEKSPLVVISGAPGTNERVRSPLLHHRVRTFETQLRIYEQVTAAAVALDDPRTVPMLVDSALDTCVREKRPVYLELPRDLVSAPCAAPGPHRPVQPHSDRASLDEAVAEAVALLSRARRPVILAGVELHRFGLQAPLLRLVERTGYPVAATLLGKSVISERHPRYLGIYEGAMGHERVRRAVENADRVLILGAFMTDINLGIYTARLDPARTIYAHSGTVAIGHHHYDDVFLGHFIARIADARLPRRRTAVPRAAAPLPFRPHSGDHITMRRLFARLDQFLDDDTVVICDIGDSLFGGADLTIHRRTEFLSPAYYASMGFSVPAALGAQIADMRRRPLVIVGDGAFQMTGQELSTITQHRLNPIVLVLNNKGYTTERAIHDGPYNNISGWAYHRWPDILGDGWGCEVRTEDELEDALRKAQAHTSSFSIINVQLDPLDCSPALIRLGRRLARKVK
ncbi:alpha-keto acid decarboxylase family protein [bacterium]|nr:alpha-keto acid decarboxylase family protein [bacterium]